MHRWLFISLIVLSCKIVAGEQFNAVQHAERLGQATNAVTTAALTNNFLQPTAQLLQAYTDNMSALAAFSVLVMPAQRRLYTALAAWLDRSMDKNIRAWQELSTDKQTVQLLQAWQQMVQTYRATVMDNSSALPPVITKRLLQQLHDSEDIVGRLVAMITAVNIWQLDYAVRAQVITVLSPLVKTLCQETVVFQQVMVASPELYKKYLGSAVLLLQDPALLLCRNQSDFETLPSAVEFITAVLELQDAMQPMRNSL
ncbi:hypothetical protein M1466_00420 [Candidatus Dependentiae bacterium]|nr:hypothetical protein [Candidatus Dependentiae bacterium]